MLLEPQDKCRYNSFVAACRHGSFLQTWEWGDLKARTGWQPYRLAVEQDGEIVAAVQLLKRPVPKVRRCLLYSPGGPLFDIEQPELLGALLDDIRTLAREYGAIAYKMDPAIVAGDTAHTQLFARHGLRPAANSKQAFGGTQPRYVMQVDISPSEDEILAAFKSKWRYNIRLAGRKGITISTDCSRDQVADFYRILVETAQRDGFGVRAESYFYDMYDLLITAGLGSLFMATCDGEPVAGAITVALGPHAWYLYGASSNRHREKMPNHLLQWEMMRWAKTRGCSVYDMRGVAHKDDTDSPLYGLNRFKEGFAARYVEYIGEWDLIYSPIWYGLFRLAEPSIRKLRLLRAGRPRLTPAPED